MRSVWTACLPLTVSLWAAEPRRHVAEEGDVWRERARLVGGQVDELAGGGGSRGFWTLCVSVKSVGFSAHIQAVSLRPEIPVAINKWWWKAKTDLFTLTHRGWRKAFSCDFDWQIMAFNVFQNDTIGTIFSLTAGGRGPCQLGFHLNPTVVLWWVTGARVNRWILICPRFTRGRVVFV